jgi:hypothetical protein
VATTSCKSRPQTNTRLSSEQQFGFKAKSSTNLCTLVLEEIIDYYTRHDSPVLYAFWMQQRLSTVCITVNYSVAHYQHKLPAHIDRVPINI